VKLALHRSALRYFWPAPTGLLSILTAYAMANLDRRLFMNAHFWLELGIIVSFLASVIYSVRLFGKEREAAPRGAFIVNIAFASAVAGWLIFGFFA
jgi:hypothetical protein